MGLPRLLEKILKSESRAVVQTMSYERVEMISNFLWTHDPDSFIPHGTRSEGNFQYQPVWITAEEENPNPNSIPLTALIITLSELFFIKSL